MTGKAWGRSDLQRMVLLAACTALGPLSLNVYLPSVPAVQAEFQVDLAGVQATVSLALLAFGIGLVLLGPIADRYGRRPALLVGLALFIAGSGLGCLATGVGALTLARMVAALGAAMTFITSRAVVADLTPRDQLQRSVAQITLIMLVGQMTAPILGNFVIAAGGWRAIQLAQFLVGLALLGLVWRRIAETLPEQTRAVAQGAAGFSGLLGPSVALLRRPRFLLLMAQVGLLYSAYPAFVTLAPHLMIEAFHRPMTEYSYYFICLPLGYFLGNWAVLRFGQQLGQHRLVLIGSVFGALSALLSLLLLASGVWHPLALFLPAGTLLNLGMGLALPSVSARAVGESWPSTASGWGLVGFAQQLIAAISVQMLGFFPSTSPFPVVAVCLALTLVTFLMECLPQLANPAPAATRPP